MQNPSLNIFIRQGFTESGELEMRMIQGALDIIKGLNSESLPLNVLTGTEAQDSTTFKKTFEKENGLDFTPKNFREHRLALIDKADAFVVIRTSLSESGAFEIAYNLYGNKDRVLPMFFAIHKTSPIKTTLIRELDQILPGIPVEYKEFENPEDIKEDLARFFEKSQELKVRRSQEK